MSPLVVSPLILNVGCGGVIRKDALNIDLYDDRADINADAKDLSAFFQDESADVVIASQLLEHFNFSDGEAALREWFRVLRKGGECIVSVPDIDEVIKTLFGFPKELMDRSLYMLYGWQDGRDGMEHRSGYTPRTLRKAMEKAGFQVIWMDFNDPPRPTPSVRCIGRKP